MFLTPLNILFQPQYSFWYLARRKTCFIISSFTVFDLIPLKWYRYGVLIFIFTSQILVVWICWIRTPGCLLPCQKLASMWPCSQVSNEEKDGESLFLGTSGLWLRLIRPHYYYHSQMLYTNIVCSIVVKHEI